MASVGLGRALLERETCRYGYSQMAFRGPEADLTQPYLAFLGTTETLGPFVTRPFPYLVSEACDLECVNLGVRNAGPDVFLNDPELLRLAQGAEAVVLEVMGVANLSNAFYQVHPRRNDRFIRAHQALYDLAPGLDTTDIHFTGHLLKEVTRLAPKAAPALIKSLQATWSERMKQLIAAFDVPVHVVRFATQETPVETTRLIEPLMLASLVSVAASVTRITPSDEALAEGTDEMFFAKHEARAAHVMLSNAAHHEAAETIAKVIRRKIKEPAPDRRGPLKGSSRGA